MAKSSTSSFASSKLKLTSISGRLIELFSAGWWRGSGSRKIAQIEWVFLPLTLEEERKMDLIKSTALGLGVAHVAVNSDDEEKNCITCWVIERNFIASDANEAIIARSAPAPSIDIPSDCAGASGRAVYAIDDVMTWKRIYMHVRRH